ncbi:MAG: NADH-quinone oxidoreductase subunit J [Myxococcales bacterium]|nr:NADH-quinone oxidoreductase subunit J [Myxococcales bacterium]
MMAWIAFGIVAATLLVGAFRVVTARNLVHAVLWLGLTLAMTAAGYVLLEATFLAVMQLLLYTGGVLTLMLFGIMLTRRVEGVEVPNEAANRPRAAALALGVFALFTWAILNTPLPPAGPGGAVTAQQIGHSFLTDHLLAFEVLSVLLLAVMVGAIAIARTRDHAPAGQGGHRPGRRVLPKVNQKGGAA